MKPPTLSLDLINFVAQLNQFYFDNLIMHDNV